MMKRDHVFTCTLAEMTENPEMTDAVNITLKSKERETMVKEGGKGQLPCLKQVHFQRKPTIQYYYLDIQEKIMKNAAWQLILSNIKEKIRQKGLRRMDKMVGKTPENVDHGDAGDMHKKLDEYTTTATAKTERGRPHLLAKLTAAFHRKGSELEKNQPVCPKTVQITDKELEEYALTATTKARRYHPGLFEKITLPVKTDKLLAKSEKQSSCRGNVRLGSAEGNVSSDTDKELSEYATATTTKAKRYRPGLVAKVAVPLKRIGHFLSVYINKLQFTKGIDSALCCERRE